MTKILNFALKIKGGGWWGRWHIRSPPTLPPPKIWNVHLHAHAQQNKLSAMTDTKKMVYDLQDSRASWGEWKGGGGGYTTSKCHKIWRKISKMSN